MSDTIETTATAPDPIGRSRKEVLGFSLLGLVSMAYLTYVHYKPSGSAFCDFGPGFSCEVVNKSLFAEVFGVPISIIGLAFFVAAFAMTVRRDIFAKYIGELQAATIASLVFGLYLTYVEVGILASICVFCEFSKVVMIGMIASTARAMKPGLSKWTWYAVAAGIVGIFIARASWSLYL